MGIDGIGKPPAGTPGVSPGAASGVGSAGGASPTETFSVKAAAPSQGPAPSEALQQLERGEISLDQYLDVRVNEAVSHLAQKLAPEQLEFVRGTLREQLSSDPVLVELVRRATT